MTLDYRDRPADPLTLLVALAAASILMWVVLLDSGHPLRWPVGIVTTIAMLGATYAFYRQGKRVRG